MQNKPKSLLNRPITRVTLDIVAAIFLNIGLFYILNILAPLVVGIIIGFATSKVKDGVVITFVGTCLSYCIIFIISEWLQGFTSAPLDVAIAVFIMGLMGALGGLIGAYTFTRVRS